ncbi:immunoglobulin-like domain-containing receptor 1 [Thalassophryne amazonica]|uniref:immunoglobulin-like domain-containing receptor 1 n=1 Tax=Thalassophryne amazonica TaxID=390379 RepID=UPI001471A523|nr:immunoglobulin-like domain-containing receptor 1 [Thalassophryne amazonica]XP_034050403.1 immunoglobulin-like domain-containing receptor 1 [Thalassophryne amazonica]
MWTAPVTIVFFSLLKVLMCIEVKVPQQTYTIVPLSSVTLRCDYTTSANINDVIVTWRYKSFCKPTVLENNLILEEIGLYLGEDRFNDCPDSERTVHPVIQKIGRNKPVLGKNYFGRKFTIENKADLVMSEVKLLDAGVYFCSVDAAGDFTGDNDKKVKLFVKPEEQSATTEKLQIRQL